MSKILIVQDSPSVNMMLKFRLESEGFSVEAVETGGEGIESAVSGEYNIILLDYNLPDINGVEVCNALRQKENLSKTPILFISAKDEAELSRLTKDTGADGHISLTADTKDLIIKIRELLGT